MRGLACINLLIAPALLAQSLETEPTEPPVPLYDGPRQVETTRADWTSEFLRAADQAMAVGLFDVAARLYQQSLEEIPDRAGQVTATLRRVDALVALGRFLEARNFLAQSDLPESPSRQLREALLAYHNGQVAEAEDVWKDVDTDDFAPHERAWHGVLGGLIEEAEGDFREAEERYERVRENYGEVAGTAMLQLLSSRARLRQGESSDALVAELRQRFEEFHTPLTRARYAQQLALALHRREEIPEAVQVLEDQIRLLEETSQAYDSTLFLLGTILGERSARGRLTLEELVIRDRDPEMADAAFSLLAQNLSRSDLQRLPLATFLDVFLAEQTSHRLRDRALFLRAQLARFEGDFAAARSLLEELNSAYPASPLLEPALRDLAVLSWQRESPQYRVAADYLTRLRDRTLDRAARARLARLIGDAYAAVGDLGLAVQAYNAARTDAPDPLTRGVALFRETDALLRQGDLNRAATVLDEVAPRDVDPAQLWRSEWNLIDALRRAGEVQRAYQRVSARASALAVAELPADSPLRQRFAWLRVKLAFDTGRLAEAEERAGNLIRQLNEVESLTGENAALLGYLLLLRGQALLAANQVEAAFALFAQLREELPDERAAAFSLLVQARWDGREGRWTEAENHLTRLADEYPESLYTAAALLEAADYAAQETTNAGYRRAIQHLERLARDFPDNPLRFQARLQQAEFARLLGDFGAALILYDTALAEYPAHPARHRAELGRADTLLAQSRGNRAFFNEAVAAFERLSSLDSVPLDARIEAGCKLGTALAFQDETQRAREAYWVVLNRFLGDATLAAELGSGGRYWLARASLELAEMVESEEGLERARPLYELVLREQLPGGNLARERLAQRPAVDS